MLKLKKGKLDIFCQQSEENIKKVNKAKNVIERLEKNEKALQLQLKQKESAMLEVESEKASVEKQLYGRTKDLALSGSRKTKTYARLYKNENTN